MKKNNLNKIIILAIIGLILTISIVIFVLNYTKDDYSFSLYEKNWINQNGNKVVDVSIYNDIPNYGQAGEGVAFDFLRSFTSTYGIEFNRLSYLNSVTKDGLKDFAFRILNYNTDLTDKDILMYNDYYVIVTKEGDTISSLADIDKSYLGTLSEDTELVKYFLNDNDKLTYVSYKDIDELINNLKNDKVNYIAIPKNLYLDKILSEDLKIIYHMSELYKKYVITIKDNTFRSIINKYLKIYKDKEETEDYRSHFLNTFFKYKELSDAEKTIYNSNSYVYGYVVNMPYENTINGEFVGIMSNYLSGFEDTAKVDFKIVEYKSIEELKTALSHGEVDVVFANYKTEGLNIDTLYTSSPLKEEYVVLSKEYLIINSIRSLKGKEVYTVKNTFLYDYINNNGIKVQGFNNTDELLKRIKEESVVLIDKATYDYYKNNKFKDYIVNYIGVLDDEYTFVVRDVNKNETFYKLLNYYVEDTNYKSLMYKYNTNYIINNNKELSNLTKYLLGFITATVLIISALIFISKKKNKVEKLKKEEKLKFIDAMTSLKNRNYLNYNIKKWEENVIYPQAIVIVDLNNIKYINDNFGHEEGDEVIKEAANVLLSNQLENTDLMRTDGNEFLIYMVGYDEKGVQEFTRNINHDLKEIKHNFGATLGYSMITDDIKTIDDAINEATLSMRQAKERL